MKKALAFLVPILLLMGCFPSSFLPQTQNTPLFTEKAQLELNFVHSFRSFEHQVAYSPIKNVAVMGNFSLTNTTTMSELGIGAYKKIGKALILEAFAGYAYAELHFYDSLRIETSWIEFSPDAYHSEIYANRYFVQPIIGFRFTDNINLSLSTKFCYWDYDRYTYYANTGSSANFMYNDTIVKPHSTNSTLEPAITFKVGGAYGRFMLQTGMSLVVNENQHFQTPYRMLPFFIRAGYNMTIDFNRFKKKERPKYKKNLKQIQ